ncbi:hypothetical protein ACHAWF_005442 [Thalassiosira exigua]
MKSTSLSAVAMAVWPCPAACLVSSGSRRTSARMPSTLSRWSDINARDQHLDRRTRSCGLCFSKYLEDVALSEEPITKPPTFDGSADLIDESFQNDEKIIRTNGQSSYDEKSIDSKSERALGVLVLLTVPLAWGTFTPVVKYMYEKMDPSMPGFVFSAGYYLVAAASLGALSYLKDRPSDSGAVDPSDSGGVPDRIDDRDESEGGASITARGGWELGSYLFVGNGLQVVGLQTVPADRAAFLVQLTTVLVPLLSAVSAGRLSAVPLQTWLACIIAFIGVLVMGADDGGADGATEVVSTNNDATNGAIDVSFATGGVGDNIWAPISDLIDVDQLSSSLQISTGDFLIVLAALAYTLHVVRLGVYAPRTIPLKLAASKASTEALLSVLLVIGLAIIGSTDLPSPEFLSRTGNDVSEYFHAIVPSFTDGALVPIENASSLGVSIGAILWTGWVTCAYTIYAQSFGQSRVNPTDSNLIYTTQPLFSSMFAYFLLGETLGLYGFVGATLIGIALLLVSRDKSVQ